ncbi:hypothetical protein BW731_05985 [Vagococcus martis]|uniref:Gram-positive cocci surface proteins LPxTG domain-containing protein n=1 Tax=Vagococcus martis TaxID=1768210 RepID=A0A1V4DGY2_9ENTE|nr:LPXTG cell wall anchor domain-containing protein [Vagococcus martis]OPF87765.1 hypothetical protein BW731_05985 [Vagococcus martis]
MKKVKLTTATLAMLAGAVVAPMVSNAEESASTPSSTEVEKPEVTDDSIGESAPKEEEIEDKTSAQTPAPATGNETPKVMPRAARSVDTSTALASAKETAKQEVANLFHSGQMLEDKYYPYAKRIDAAQTPEEAQAVVNEAKNTVAAELAALKETTKGNIAQLHHSGLMSLEKYYDFAAKVDAEKTLVGIAAVEAAANSFANSDINKAQVSTKQELADLVRAGKISEEAYYNLVPGIDNATTVGEIDAVLAQANNLVSLNEEKEAAKEVVLGLSHKEQITPDDYWNFVDQIEKSDSSAAVQSVVASAKQLAELNQAKKDAKQAVADLVYEGKLTEDEYFPYAERIDAAQTPEEAKAVVADAQAKVALDAIKLEAKHEINELVHAGKITLEDYYAFEEQIDAATSEREVRSVVASAHYLSDLNDAKLEAKYTINDLVHAGKLTLDDYYAFEKDIDAATTLEGVQSVVDAANYLVALNDAKLEAKYTINDLVHAGKLTLDDYYTFEKDIDASTTLEEVASVVETAKQLVALNEAKEAGKYTISDMVYADQLTLNDYYHFAEQIENAKDVKTVDEILETAKALSAARIAADAELLEFLSEGKITPAQYKEYKAQILNAKTAEEVEAIMADFRALFAPEETEKPGEETGKPGEGEEPAKTDANKGNNKADSKKSVVVKQETTKNNGKKVLPQTGDTVEKGLILGGLTAMLSSAALYFRKK